VLAARNLHGGSRRLPVQTLLLLLVLLSTLTLGGCELIGDIFQAGMAVGVIIVVLILAGIFYLVKKIF
jgi:hypothetical protein